MGINRLLIGLLTGTVLLALPSVALGNFAIHGNYVSDTDACAGCHRAHTSISTITWEESGGDEHSALLVTSATEIWEFCYACHDASSQGADTNVQQGIYEGTLYGTQDALLNGGGFDSLDQTATTSSHMPGGSGGGGGGGGGGGTKMDCVTCHDPHGSPNYRILKTVVRGRVVGEYTPSADPTDPDPDGFVSSVEPGWPVNGFRLHTSYPAYTPNYTTPMYAKGYDMPSATLADGSTGLNPTKGMSGWCAGCHSTYLGPVETFTKTSSTGITTSYQSVASTFSVDDGSGLALRHQHPINVELTTYNGPDKSSMVVTDSVLPLSHGIDEQGAPVNRTSDWIECLTCHRAHGTAASMTGYASNAGAASVVDTDGVARNLFPTNNAVPSALLRYNNRGVCERCHNK